MLSWPLDISSLFLRIFLLLKKEMETKNIIIIDEIVRIINGSINIKMTKINIIIKDFYFEICLCK